MKNLRRKIKKSAKRILASFLMMTTVMWSLGVPLTTLVPKAEAASAPTAGQVLISEIKVQDGGDTAKQFVELYNATSSNLELEDCGLATAPANSSGSLSWTQTGATIAAGNSKIIPAYGYFLFTPSGYEPYGIISDIAGTLNLEVAGGYVALRCDVTGTPVIIDQVGYGTTTDASLCKGSACASAPGTGSVERKAAADSTVTTMSWGGSDEFLGNKYDSDGGAGGSDNADFIQRPEYQDDPQKSTFPMEFDGFIIMDVMPMSPQMVNVRFNKPIDSASVSTSVATLSTANATDNETITSISVINSNELEIYASGANIDGSTGNDTITISNAVTDTGSNANITTSAQTIKFYMPPEVTGVQYIDNDNIKVHFSKAMEEVSAENASAYSVYVDGLAVDISTGTTLALNTGGNSKELTITKTGAFDISGAGDDYVMPDYDPSVASKDIEGNSLQYTFGWQQQFPIDGTKPTITGGMFDANTVTLYFSEELMSMPGSPAETATNYTFGGATGACGGTKSVVFKENTDGPPSLNIVVITCSGGVTLNADDTVTVSTNVTDKAGNVMDTSGTPAKNIFTVSATTNTPIKIESVSGDSAKGSWNMSMDGCTDEYGETGNYLGSGCTENATTNRDTLTVVFDGSINPSSINYDSTNSLTYNIGSYLEIYDKHSRSASSSSDCQSWEVWNGSDACVDKMMGSFGSSFAVLGDADLNDDGDTSDPGETDNKVTIYLQGYDVNIWPGMEVNPTGIMGMNGLAAQQNSTAANNQFTMTFAEVEFVKVGGLTQGDVITFFFSGDMNRSSVGSFADANTNLKPVQHMPFWQEHNWGSSGSIAWGNHDGATCDTGAGAGTGSDGTADCLKITLGSSPTVANKDDVMTSGVTDANGMYLGWGGMIDTTTLALSNFIWNGTSNILVLEFNKMLKDYNAVGSPPTADFSDNTISATGVGISAKVPAFDMTDGPMDMFKKIKLTLDAAIEAGDSFDFSGSAIGDENGNLVPNISVVAASPTGNQVAPISDTQGPVLRKVISNDWNSDGILNGGDEITLIFDNEVTDTDSSNVCDVDYSTWNDINTEFVVKRNGSAISNAFGDWASYWIDMWEEQAGELHINLGSGSDIQAGDEIWATGANLADYAGNKLSTSSALATIQESRNAEITKVVYNDNGTAGLTDGDTFVVYFSEEVDPATLGAYTSGGSPEVTNIGWGLGIEFNWESGYGSTYDASVMKTWGSSSTGDWNDPTFTQLTITIACTGDCDAVDGSEPVLSDSDMVMPYGVRSASGGWIQKPGFIDMTKPTLNEVILVDDANSDGNVNAGDKIVLIFSEEMNESTITGANFTISAGDFGTNPTISCPAPGVCEITLDSDAVTIPSAATIDPKDAVTDLAGLADNTPSAVSIQTVTAASVSSVNMADGDSQYSGIDGRDITITWTAPGDYDSKDYKYQLYIVPDFISLNPIALTEISTSNKDEYQFPIAELTEAQADCETDSSCTWTGAGSLMTDSRTLVDLSTGLPASSIDYADVSGVYNSIFPLNDWDTYKAFIVSVNVADGSQSFLVSTPAAVRLTMEYGGSMDDTGPWVEGTMPFDGAIIPINTSKMSVKFSEPMNRASVETTGNIKIQQCSTDCHLEGSWSDISQSAYASYDSDLNEAKISLASDLAANTKYRLYISSSGVTDLSGLSLAGSFTSYFRTSSESDSTAPQVQGNSFQFEGKNLSSISRTEPMIGISFNKDMDHSTFTTTSVTLSPEVPGSEFFYDPMMMGLAYFFGSPLEKNTSYTLTLSGVYVKDIAGNTLDGDNSGTASGDTSDNYVLTFTTENVDLNTSTKPIISWVFSDTNYVDVGFSMDMKMSTVTDKSNWVLTQSDGTIISLQGANFDYDAFMSELHIGPVNLTPGLTYTLTPSSSVLGMSGTAIDTSSSVLDFVPESWDFTMGGQDMYATGGMYADGGMFDSDNMTAFDGMMSNVADPAAGMTYMGAFDPMMAGKMFMDDAYLDQDIMTFMPIDAWPMNQIEGQTTNYHIGFPTTKAIPHGGKIVLQFPSGFDLTSVDLAKDEFLDPNNPPLFFFNRDINGPGGTMDENGQFNPEGKVQVSSVAINNMDKTIVLTVAVEDSSGCTSDSLGNFEAACTNTSVAGTNSTMPFDYIDFELSGIKNGAASEIDWMTNTGGYQITITTKDNNGKVLEGGSQKPIKSSKFPIKSAGVGSISGKVTAQDGVTAVANAMIFIDSPMSGPIDTKTGADGTYSLSGLPVASSANNMYEGWYHIRVESPKNDENYFGGADFDVQLTSDNPTASDKNVRLASAANTLTVTVETTLIDEDLMIWVGGTSGYNEKKVTLNSNSGDNDQFTIKVADGVWDVGIHPFFSETMFSMGPPPPPSFMPPAPKNVTITGDASITISLDSAGYEITGMVRDGVGGNGLSNVHVQAFNSSGGGFPADTETRTDGSFTLKVPAGIYQVEAFKPGLPSVLSQTVEVKDSSVSGVEIIIHKPDTTISGTVTDGTNGIRYAGVNAWDNDGRFASTDTNENGDYILYVDASASWSVEVFVPGYGKISPASGVTATNLDTTSGSVSGVNFSTATSNIVTISGLVSDASGNAVSGVEIWADQVSWSGGTEGNMTGVGNFTKTDTSGSYTLKVSASTAGAGSDATRYRISGWYPDSGDLTPITGVDASSSVTGQNFTLPTSRTVTIDIQNAPSNNLLNSDHADYIGEAFVDIYSDTAGKGNGKMITDSDLSDTTDGTINVSEGSGYRAYLHIPGYGEFGATENGTTGFSLSGSNKTIHFDLKRGDTAITPVTISGSVADNSSTAIENAWVSVINETTYETVGTTSDSSGNYSIKVPDLNPDGSAATYKVRVDKPGYSGSTAIENVAADKNDADFIMTTNSSSVSGTVYSDSAKTTPVSDAMVMAKQVGGEGFIKTTTDSQGNFSLDVAPGETWNIVGKSVVGNKGQKVNINSGASDVDVVLTDQIKAAEEGQLTTTPKIQSMTPSEGGIFNDVDNTGVKLTIPSRALGSSSAAGQVQAREIASVPETTDYRPLGGIGKEITAVDSDGSSITRMSSDMDIEFVFKKDKMEAMTETDATHNNLAQLDQMKNIYWDDTSNNYVALATVKTVKTKATISDSWTPTDWDTFVDNVDNSDADGAYDNYYDYEVTLKSKTDHFTIFGVVTGSDSTAPSAPAGLSQSAGIGTSVTLDWNDNSEADLMEYEVYRSVSSGVTADNDNQINTAQVAVSNFTDSTTTAWTSYYYTVTAADDSGNESAVADEIRVCSTKTVSNGTVAADCSITCDSNYTISGNNCVANAAPSSGGGGTQFTGSILVSDNAAQTTSRNVTLQLSSTGATQMAISNLSDFTGISWESYTTSKEWTLEEGDGLKTVYAKFKNSAGTVSAVASDNITLNTTAADAGTSDTTGTADTADTTGASVDTSGADVNPGGYYNGALVRAIGDYKVYIVKDGFKRWIQSADIFGFYGHLNFAAVNEISADTVNSYQQASLIRADGDPKVYEVNGDGTKHWLNMTAEQFAISGRDWNMVYVINQKEVDYYKTGPNVMFVQ